MKRMTPRGAPTTSTERMQIKKLRDQGVLPPLPVCSHPGCTRALRAGCGSDKAFAAGMCWEHWKTSEQGRLERRRQNLVSKVWAVGYFSAAPGGPLEKRENMRTAIGATFAGRGVERNPVYVVWSTGAVTAHANLNVRNAKALSPEHPTATLVTEPGLVRILQDQVPEKLRAWFGH